MPRVDADCPTRRLYAPVLTLLLLLCPVPPVDAQTVGSIIGRVVESGSGEPLAAAAVEVMGTPLRATTAADGRFIIGAVPPGERSLRVERLGYKPLVMEGLLVRTGRTQELRLELEPAPVAVEGVVVEAQRVRLVEPEVSSTHDIIVARELRALPVDRLDQVVELTPGVSGGHFRGGRVGQEVYVVDGLELKNQFEASSQGAGLELSPTSLEEVEVITGGFGAQYGSALSGVVSYVTRRGNRERWDGRVVGMTDQWAPTSMFYGFTSLSASGGGPLPFLGGGSTLFLDVLAQGMLDAEPRARGLTCLQPEDAEPDLSQVIQDLRTNAPAIACPFEHAMLPNQRGDRLIGFARLDRDLTRNLHFYATVLRNRDQRELYTPEYRYNANGQLGQRTIGSLGTLNLDWSRNVPQRAYHVAARVGLMRLDRYLGVVDPRTFDRPRIAGFGFGEFDFFGEEQARAPIESQLAQPTPLPGYVAPGGSSGTPYGSAATGIFFTDGTPHLASWARTDLVTVDLVSELLGMSGSSLRTGGSAKFYRIESYERTLSHLAGSLPNYARFFPGVISGFTEGRLGVTDEITINIGLRVDAFRSGISFLADREDFLSPVIDPSWQLSLNPRFGIALPIPGTDNSMALRLNYTYVSQPPDFRYFLDTAVGDSLRTDIRRQGNPHLSFEKGKSYEAGFSALVNPWIGVGVTLFRKELTHLVSGSLRVSASGEPLYSTDDEGTVNGVEASLRGQWPEFSVRASWALQKAVGVASGTESDTVIRGDARFLRYPLAFDRRHSVDFAFLYGRAAGASSAWSGALAARAQSGYPIDRLAAAGEELIRGSAYLPWTAAIDLRASRDVARLPGCDACVVRVAADARNLIGRENVIAVRRDTGGLAPALQSVQHLVDAVPVPAEIPAESPSYSRRVDSNGDGVITPEEFRRGRTAAVLDRFNPSLYFGEPRQVRVGLEVTF